MTTAVAVTIAPVSDGKANKELVSDQLWTRLTNRIVKDEDGIDLTLAERIMDQALGFLRLCAATGAEPYSPSPLVDVGWHTFILYTREYAAFCARIAGRFIHHDPSDGEGVGYGTGNIARTVAAMKIRGINVDEPLWTNAGNCQAGCSAYCSNDSCSGGGR